jgi:hypothetical protein
MPAGDALRRMAFIRDQTLARQFTDEGCTVYIAVFLFAPFLARALCASKDLGPPAFNAPQRISGGASYSSRRP